MVAAFTSTRYNFFKQYLPIVSAQECIWIVILALINSKWHSTHFTQFSWASCLLINISSVHNVTTGQLYDNIKHNYYNFPKTTLDCISLEHNNTVEVFKFRISKYNLEISWSSNGVSLIRNVYYFESVNVVKCKKKNTTAWILRQKLHSPAELHKFNQKQRKLISELNDRNVWTILAHPHGVRNDVCELLLNLYCARSTNHSFKEIMLLQ